MTRVDFRAKEEMQLPLMWRPFQRPNDNFWQQRCCQPPPV